MSIDVKIQDGKGSKRHAKVGPEGDMYSYVHSSPPFGGPDESFIFTDYFRDVNGDFEMAVDGDPTPVDFIIEADQVNDLYIKSITFEITDAGATLRQFGNIGELINGMLFFYEDNSGQRIINDNLVSNWEFIRMCGFTPAFGDANTVFKANNVRGNSEAYLAKLDFSAQYGMPYGLRLNAGSSQRLVIRVRDDITGVDGFTAVAYGFERLPEEGS